MNLLFLQRHNWSQRFWAKLVKNWQKALQSINIYYIGCITIKKIDECETISNVNPLYLRINHASGYVEEKNGNKYLIFNSVDESKEVLQKYAEVWDGIKSKIKGINSGKKKITKKITLKLNLILTMTCH